MTHGCEDLNEGADLWPCPFCGGEARIYALAEPHEYVVECECGAASPIVTAIMDSPVPALEQAWNKRLYRISQGVSSVLTERNRQWAVEGFDPARDDQYVRGELALAATCYVAHVGLSQELEAKLGEKFDAEQHRTMPALHFWPWSRDWWKPTDRRRDLVKAAALIIAEIERLDRAAAQAEQP